MRKEKQLTYPEALKVLRASYEQEKIQLTVKISTLEVTISQLQGELNRREEKIKDLGQVKDYLLDERDSLFNALIVCDPHYVPDSVSVDVQEGHNPEPHPYTNPIRDLPDYSKVKRSKPNA